MTDETEAKEIYAFGFISIDQPTTENQFNFDQCVCFALISLDGKDLENIHVEDIYLLPYYPKAIAEKVLAYNLKIVGIDEENYNWLRDAWISESNKLITKRPDRAGKLPLLRGLDRNPDQHIRQVLAIQTPKAQGHYSVAQEITDPIIRAGLENYGHSIICDAIAGAIEIATDQRQIILDNLSRPDEDEEWLGMQRLKYFGSAPKKPTQ